MGFLDDLKRQAAELQARDEGDTAARERNTLACEAACQRIFKYLDSLATQLRVIKPSAPTRYGFDRQHLVDGLTLGDVQVDERRRVLRNTSVFEYIVLHGHRRSGQRFTIVCDFPPDIERLENRLRQSGTGFDGHTVRDPVHGRVVEVRYDFFADVVVRLRLVPDHDRGRIVVTATNLDGLETLSFELAAELFDDARLDELARWFVGQPNRFLGGAERLSRTEP